MSWMLAGCLPFGGESFESKVAPLRQNQVDQTASVVGKGLPFFTLGGLTPTWNEADSIVQLSMPLSFQDQDGHARTQSLFEGRPTILAFFFTSCPGFCPTLVHGLKAVERKLGKKGAAQLVLLSVDPEVDTPKQLKRYARTMKLDTNKEWHLLQTDRKQVDHIAKTILSSEVLKRETAPGNNYIHSELFYVFDKQARLRAALKGTHVDTPAEIERVVRQL